MLAPDYSLDELRGVRPEPVIFDAQSIQPIAPEMVEFARQLNTRSGSIVEKRSSTRHAVVATLKVMELDAQLFPVGTAFHAICRNLSTGGICLINECAVPSKLLVIELSAAQGVPIQAIAQVLRRRPLGPYFDIGCEFVTKLASPSSEKPA
jgi:hypothetical protein